MTQKLELGLLVARSRNGVIGRDNQLPWRLRDDLQCFKQRTLGNPIIMGRKTWESLGKPLPGRQNIVITRQAEYRADGATIAHSLNEAIALCAELERAYIIGGADIYRQALPLVEVLWISEVAAEIDGDAHFPEIAPNTFSEIRRQHFDQNESNQFAFDIVEYRRSR